MKRSRNMCDSTHSRISVDSSTVFGINFIGMSLWFQYSYKYICKRIIPSIRYGNFISLK